MKSIFFALIAIIGLTGMAAADQTYECKLKAHSRYGWIAPVLLLAFDENSKSAVVYDGMIKEVVGEPIPAKFTRRDQKSVKLNWVVRGVPLSNRRQKVTAEYSAILWTNTGRISVTVYLSGMDMDPPRGTGTCKLVKKK